MSACPIGQFGRTVPPRLKVKPMTCMNGDRAGPWAGVSRRPLLLARAALGRRAHIACLAFTWADALASGPELELPHSYSRAAHAGPSPVIGRAGGHRVRGLRGGRLCRGGVLSAGSRTRHHGSRGVGVQRALHHANPGTQAQGSGAIQRHRGDRAVHLDRRARRRLDPYEGLPRPNGYAEVGYTLGINKPEVDPKIMSDPDWSSGRCPAAG